MIPAEGTYFYFMCMGILEIIIILCGQCLAGMHVCTVYEHGVLRGRRRALDLLEPELQMVVSCFMCDENLTQVLWKGSQCS